MWLVEEDDEGKTKARKERKDERRKLRHAALD